MWNGQFEQQMILFALSIPQKISIIVRNAILRCVSLNDALEVWVSIHLIINYSFLHGLNGGDSVWMSATKYSWPFALCILVIHFYSLIKYSPSAVIYMRVLITAFLFPRIDILHNIILAFLLQTSLANGKCRLFSLISTFICDHKNNNFSKKTKIICCHYYLMKLYNVTKEMYLDHYSHLYHDQRIINLYNYYQNNLIENLQPKICREVEKNLTNRSTLSLSSICISNWTYLWHIVLGYDKFWIVNFYNRNYIYYAVEFVYINLLFAAIIQYLCKLYCFMHVLQGNGSVNSDGIATIIFILLGEFLTFGYVVWYVRKKDNCQFIVRLYQQRFVLRVLDAYQISSHYVNRKTLNDIQLLSKYYRNKRFVFQILYESFGISDIATQIMKYMMPNWQLSIKLSLVSETRKIQSNIEQYNICNHCDGDQGK